jgi:hypothetical protein
MDEVIQDTRYSDRTDVFQVLEFADELFLVIVRLQMFLLPKYSYTWTCAENFRYVLARNLIDSRLHRKKIMTFTPDELFGSFHLLADSWFELTYDVCLTDYIKMLTTRAAELFFLPYHSTEEILDREELLENGKRCLKRDSMAEIGWAVREMWKKLKIHEYILENTTTQLNPSFTSEDQERFLTRVLPIDGQGDAIDPFREECMDFILQPGEQRHYAKRFPKKPTNPTGVFVARDFITPAEITLKLKSLQEPIRFHIEDDSLFGTCVSELALLQLACMYIRLICPLSLDSFIIRQGWLFDLENDIDIQFLTRPYPIIVQSFNWFCLVYKKKYYPHNDVLNSVLHWIQIVASPPFSGQIDGATITELKLEQYDFFNQRCKATNKGSNV